MPPVQTQTRKIITVKAVQSSEGMATLVPINQEITLFPLDQPVVKPEGSGGTRDIIGQSKFQKLLLDCQHVADGLMTPGPLKQEGIEMDCPQIEPLLELAETAASVSYKFSHLDDNKLVLTYPAGSNSQFVTQNTFCEGKEISTLGGAALMGLKGNNFVVNDDHGIFGAELPRSDGVISTLSSNNEIPGIQTSQQVTEKQKRVTLATDTLTSGGLKFESVHVTGHVMGSSAPSGGENNF